MSIAIIKSRGEEKFGIILSMKISRFNILWHIVFVSSFLTFTIALLLGGGSLGELLLYLGLGILFYGLLYLLLRKNYKIGKFWGAAINYLGAVISLTIATLLLAQAVFSCIFTGCRGGENFIFITFLVTSSVLTFLLGYMRLVSRWKVKPLISTIIFLPTIIFFAMAIFALLRILDL